MSDPYTDPDFTAAALITIDTQRDVLDGGPLEIAGTSAALEGMRLLAREFRRAGRPIVHIVRLYEPDGSNVDLCRRQAVQNGARILAPGALGSQLAVELLPERELALDGQLLLAGGVQSLGPGEVAIYKPRWGAFYHTPLEAHLREQHITTLVFCGCNFPNCPRTSMYEASERDFRVVLARDAISGLYERGERELANIGVRLMGTTEVSDAIAAASGVAARTEPGDRRSAAAADLARAGARNAPVEIVEYDPTWPALYAAERARLAPLLGDVELHHFGSTAVPGLAAKPVIDMIALVGDLDAPIAALVSRGGYQYPPAFNATLTHRRFLCYPTASHRTHHLHLVDDHKELDRRLRFRDWLRADPALADEYVALKRELAARYREDREAYTDAKGTFVERMLKTKRPSQPVD